MADLEERVTNLENKVRELEININNSLNEIKIQLTEISTALKNNSNNGDLKNELIEKDVKQNTKDIEKLKDNQSRVVWALVMAFLGILGEALIYFIQNKP